MTRKRKLGRPRKPMSERRIRRQLSIRAEFLPYFKVLWRKAPLMGSTRSGLICRAVRAWVRHMWGDELPARDRWHGGEQ